MACKQWLMQADREYIEKMYAEGSAVKSIAEALGRNQATIYKELHRGSTGKMDKNGRPGYSARIAQESAYKVRVNWAAAKGDQS